MALPRKTKKDVAAEPTPLGGKNIKFLSAISKLKVKESLIRTDDGCEPLTSTDSIVLDDVLQLGGIPGRGRVVTFHGEQHSCKSTIMYHVIKSIQKHTGNPCVVNDFERTSARNYMDAMGVNMNPDMLFYWEPDNLKSCIQTNIELMVEGGAKCLLFDSIPRMKSKVDIKDVRSGQAFKQTVGKHARDMQDFFDIILPYAAEYDATILMVNQIRARIDASQEAALAQKYPSFTNLPYSLPGGNAVRFVPSIMIETKVGKAFRGAGASDDPFLMEPEIKDRSEFVATKIKVRILKNKVTGGGYRQFHVWIRPGKGLDDWISVRELARQYGLIERRGGKWEVGAADNVVASYATKEEAIQQLVITPDLEVLTKLRPQVQKAIAEDSKSFGTTLTHAERYLAGDEDDDGGIVAPSDEELDGDDDAVFEIED